MENLKRRPRLDTLTGRTSSRAKPSDILGFKLDKNLRFSNHNLEVNSDLRHRLGLVRRLTAYIPRGRLLNIIANALIIGRLRVGAWITRTAKLKPGQSPTNNRLDHSNHIKRPGQNSHRQAEKKTVSNATPLQRRQDFPP